MAWSFRCGAIGQRPVGGARRCAAQSEALVLSISRDAGEGSNLRATADAAAGNSCDLVLIQILAHEITEWWSDPDQPDAGVMMHKMHLVADWAWLSNSAAIRAGNGRRRMAPAR
jgi:hypothetical protein